MPFLHTDKIIHYFYKSLQENSRYSLYAIVDAARDDRLYSAIVSSDCEHICLFRGATPDDLATVAPYLFKLSKEAHFTRWLISHGWTNSWSIFLRSTASLKQLRNHFRKFLMIYGEGGKPLYFRYYDPRVFRVFLPTCDEKQLEIIYGPVNRYFIEGEKSNELLEYTCTEKLKLIHNVVNLEKASSLSSI